MRVAGLGFRTGTTAASLRAALELAGGPAGVTVLATTAAKAADPAILTLARDLGLQVQGVPPGELGRQKVMTQSPRVIAMHGTGSVAEAAALAAAGPGARLTGPRMVSPDRMATAALAERGGT